MSTNRDTDADAPSEGWTVPVDPANPGLGRRTVIAGAAWSLPVIAAAIAVPLAAASALTPTLEFTQGAYAGSDCAPITGVKVRRTTDGTTPDAGKPITVTLSGGYEFADGTTTFTAISDASGTITLPDVMVPDGGATDAFGAVSGGLSTTAPVTSVPGVGSFTFYLPSAREDERPNVPDDAVAVGGAYYLAPGGRLYDADGTLIASGVTSATGQRYLEGGNTYRYIEYNTATGTFKYDNVSGTSVSESAVPAGAKPVGGRYYLAQPGGRLYFGDGTLVATGVTAAVGERYWNNGAVDYLVDFSTASGVATYNARTKVTSTRTTIPAGAKPVGGDYYLATNGNLYYGNGDLVATGVLSADGQRFLEGAAHNNYVDYSTATGNFSYYNGNASIGRPNVPAGSKPVGGAYYLAPNGTLYFASGRVVATNVTSAVGERYYDAGAANYYVDYTADC